MRFRPLCIFILLYQALFLNVVVPGHTRGMITLSGKSSADEQPSAGCSCCCEKPRSPGQKKEPTSKDRANCAICHLAARFTPPPVFSFSVSESGLLAVLPIPPPSIFEPATLIPTYYACGPPASY